MKRWRKLVNKTVKVQCTAFQLLQGLQNCYEGVPENFTKFFEEFRSGMRNTELDFFRYIDTGVQKINLK